jgi:hypothetical protein
MANFFPRSSNVLPLKVAVMAAVIAPAVCCGMWYYFTPKYTRVGYQPIQPVAFSHNIHVSQLGMDCRYCHSYVEVAAHSNVPNTQTCMACHSQVQKDNPRLAPLRESWKNGTGMQWVQIHKTPDYVYFNHSVHVNRGVSCFTCHGQVNKMDVVWHDKPHSMAWCLDCHRNPETQLRPREQVFNLDWSAGSPEKQIETGTKLKHDWNVKPPTNCAGCHR